VDEITAGAIADVQLDKYEHGTRGEAKKALAYLSEEEFKKAVPLEKWTHLCRTILEDATGTLEDDTTRSRQRQHARDWLQRHVFAIAEAEGKTQKGKTQGGTLNLTADNVHIDARDELQAMRQRALEANNGG